MPLFIVEPPQIQRYRSITSTAKIKGKTRSAIFSLLHCKPRDARLMSLIRFTANSGRQDLLSLEDKICYFQFAPLQTQGCQADIFDPLHCKLRKTRSAIFNLLHCKLRDARLISSICSTVNSGRQDLLSLVCSTVNSGMPDYYLRSASL
ncbi:hypothetical protein J1N35_036452 [Gossypium stocksii]|uniref:Uncharacterized protein n=1 Tax=Gossypium stocksii TaxID=47602 RepID=A0A9D3UIG3_9ROSI|nr:hypothetical protein J1N35_036452 [Gossypium stocksii]